MLARPVVGPGEAALDQSGIDGVQGFLDADHGRPAGRTSILTSPLVSALTSAANSLSMCTSSALDGITDCTRIFTSASAVEEAKSIAAARPASPADRLFALSMETSL